MKLNQSQLDVINRHTIEVFPHEAVFAITATTAVPLKNIHPQPEEHFKVDSREYFSHNPIALVHSHPIQKNFVAPDYGSYYDCRTPSDADMSMQIQLDVPFGILSTDGVENTEIVWFPDLDSPIIGNKYIAGVTDCFRVARAFYWQEYGLKIIDYPRNYGIWASGDNVFAKNLERAGFYEIEEQDIKRGDAMLMKLTATDENHCAIYLGGDEIIHHINNRLSEVTSLTKWRRKVTRFLRHESRRDA